MPRCARVVLPGVPHHVILRGNNRRRLFSYPRDYSKMLNLMADRLDPGDVRLNAYCLMTNHVHLLVVPEATSALAQFVKGFAQRYAQHRNRVMKASGKLFEERYYSKPIVSNAHLALATAYIDLNPLRAGITDAAETYRWSTFAFHAEADFQPPFHHLWSPSTWYASLGEDKTARARAYRAWAAERLELAEWKGVRAEPTAHPGSPVRRPNRTRAAG